MNTEYKAILFHPDGDYVSDFYRDTKQDVLDELENMGSRWIFYPIPFVSTDKTIVDTPEGLEFLKGKRITTVKKLFNDQWKKDSQTMCDILNDGAPLFLLFN